MLKLIHFIRRRADRQGQPSFALDSVQPESQAALTTNSEVEFSMGEAGPHKLVAVNILVLPAGSISDSELLEGVLPTCLQGASHLHDCSKAESGSPELTTSTSCAMACFRASCLKVAIINCP